MLVQLMQSSCANIYCDQITANIYFNAINLVSIHRDHAWINALTNQIAANTLSYHVRIV